MMINKRFIQEMGESKKYIFYSVFLQWFSLLSNIVIVFMTSYFIQAVYRQNLGTRKVLIFTVVIVFCMMLRLLCSWGQGRVSFYSSSAVKSKLRRAVYAKVLALGNANEQNVSTSEFVQIATEGIEQLEVYFAAYLPQLIYALLAPTTLFLFLVGLLPKLALLLLLGVPIIPLLIAAVQTLAKKLFKRYWGRYLKLGDLFLENLQGLTTLKIYQADERKHKQMNLEAERFRQITMSVLKMQLNSITVMDLVAFFGAAIAILLTVSQYRQGNLSLAHALVFVLISAEFFIPIRVLGSLFHVAMNGMAASDKIVNLLDREITDAACKSAPENMEDIVIKNLSFAYSGPEEEKTVLDGINLHFRKGGLHAIIGQSGCGKSTLAGILVKKNVPYRGSVKLSETELQDICTASLLQNVHYLGHQSFLFKGSLRENLLLACPDASDECLWEVLDECALGDFFRGNGGLAFLLQENAANLSGGQRQRLGLARAILSDAAVYLFDEVTSNVDVQSEKIMVELIKKMSREKLVILITHRLAPLVAAQQIVLLSAGKVDAVGSHTDLLQENELYQRMWREQQELEKYTGEGETSKDV